MTHTQKKAPLRSFFAKMPLQWRLTALTTLLVTVACIFMYFFIMFGNMDSIYHSNIWKVTSHVEKNSIYRYNIINVSSHH